MRIAERLREIGVEAKVVRFREPVKTTADCEKQGVSPGKIVKSILLVLGGEKRMLAVLLGSDGIAFRKLRKLTGIKNIRTASPDEVLDATGFQVGGVIPTIPGIETLIDTKVMALPEVWSGGGDSHTLLKLKTSELAKFGKVTNFHKEDLNKPRE